LTNRVKFILGIHECDSPDDNSKWECVRKGLCCICCESNIDSLLYRYYSFHVWNVCSQFAPDYYNHLIQLCFCCRCGHLCTCSRCANELLQSRRNCPMCHAPVLEVIRTYSIL